MLNILPDKNNFIEAAKTGIIYPVYAQLPFTPPHEIYNTLESPYSFLLESAKGPEKIARYSFAGIEPFLIFKVKDGVVEIETKGQRDKGTKGQRIFNTTVPLKTLKELLTCCKIDSPPNLPPFIGGAVGLLSYDFVQYFERLPKTVIDDLKIPDAHFLFFDTVIAFDHKDKKVFIISCHGAEQILSSSVQSFKGANSQKSNIQSPKPNPQSDYGSYYDRACEKINALYKKISSNSLNSFEQLEQFKQFERLKKIEIHHEMGKEKYMNIVRKAKEYIKAGDIFQANLSQRVSADIGNTTPWQIYLQLKEINPSPFAGYLNMGDYHIVSSSPERLLRIQGNTVETRPIAGTRPRGADAGGDKKMRAELLLNEKERAEHLMLIDLERNDLGRISDYGSVLVDEFMATEDYSHVIHIVSNVSGTLAKGRDCFDAIRAAFPGGTITGVPKVRCMEIIDELEPVARGPYTGSFGYIGFNRTMDLNIIIRTFVIKNNIAYVQAGAGIVADSEPEKEYYETLKKAEALIRTLGKL
ncbi:MAG: anthranilate synthase component I family protein [Nitrospirae bacterium]|nr:anthranilate synthase component I family protein [Nitrospirota bacterium]